VRDLVNTAATSRQRRWLAGRLSRRAVDPAVAAKRGVQFSLLVLLALLVAVVGNGLFATYNLYRSAEDRYVRVAFPLQTLTRDVLFRMSEEESAVRGYMITSDRRSLGPYKVGRDAVLSDLRQLKALVRDRPSLAARLQDVQGQVRGLHGFYDRLIVFVADSELGGSKLGPDRAAREALDGEKRSRKFRDTAFLMQKDIEQFVQTTRDQQRATYNRTIATLSVAGLLALAVAAAMLFRVPERLRRLYAAEQETRRQAEQGANAARALEHVSEAVLLVDGDGSIRFWNAGAEQLFGIAPTAAVGRRAAIIVPEYGRLVDAATRGDRFVPLRIEDVERWVAPAVSAFEGGSVLAVRDATAGYVLERARADFVTTASHELRTPLTTVYGAARTLSARHDQLSGEQTGQLLVMIEQESEHLVQIVDQLLVSAQLDRGALHLDESEVDVRALCSAVIESARLRAAAGREIAFDAPPAVTTVRCDESLLRQVLVNLVENALKYSLNGGRIEVRVLNESASVQIEVEDEGLGIPSAEQERIFEKFYRLDAAMTRGVGGSGLGLYISREIVTQMGGSLSVRSVPDVGSTFTVTLPRRV
jgi:signal transduction histidine kinase